MNEQVSAVNSEHVEEQKNTRASEPNSPRQEAKRELIDFAKMVGWFLLLFLALRTFVVEGYEVQGDSMSPSLDNRERILVLKLPHVLSQFRPFHNLNAIEEGDIVVFQSPDDSRKRYVKRVIAKGSGVRPPRTVEAESQGAVRAPIEDVRVRVENGQVYVNNRRIEEEYLNPDNTSGADTYDEVLLQPGTYYVLGDNRNVSKDSRSFGPVDEDGIIGRAFLRVWPLGRISLIR